MLDIHCIRVDMKELLDSFTEFMSADKYIGFKEYDRFVEKYSDIYVRIKEFTGGFTEKELFDKVMSIKNDKRQLLRNHNLRYLKRKLFEYKEYFDTMFRNIDSNIILDDNQRMAVLADEDNLLIVAGAGSGKTTTMAAKVKYLIDKCYVRQDEIAVISFTKKATEEIADRIQDKFGLKNVAIYTFHKLGLEILKSSGKDIVDIIDDGGKYKILSNYIKEVLFKDKDLFKQFYEAFKGKLYFKDEWNRFDSFFEYHNYIFNKKYQDSNFDLATYITTEISKRRDYKKTINGEYVKSKEEVDIANFLYLNQIHYEYEKIYDKKIGDNKIYKPDFHIQELDKHNYIEHFGVDQNYFNSMYTEKELQKYLNMMRLKMKFHNEPPNYQNFIVTYSSYRDSRSTIDHLKEELINLGYTLSPVSKTEIFNRLKDTSEDVYFGRFIDRIVIPFITTFKGRGYDKTDFEWLKEKAKTLGISDQIEVMEKILLYYENKISEQHRIDFEDMINMAYKIMPKLSESHMKVDYNYIIIDEYQDISMQRYNLTKRISDLFEAKIMAVGDDWQSIFGFAGADVNLFVGFKKYLEGAKMIPIENTYRNSQELIDLAGNFIQKNQDQLKKNLKSFKHLTNPVEVFIYDDSSILVADATKAMAVSKIIEKIYSENPNDKILLMGRYKDDIFSILRTGLFSRENREQIISKNCPKASIDFLTIHSAKGLGYDQCILINAADEKFGFPSKIEDEAIIKLIKPEINESIMYPEERRLFYVALTRTKNKLYVVAPSNHISSFIDEISDDSKVLVHSEIIKVNEPIKTNYTCPNCHFKLKMINYKNSDFWIYVCEQDCGFMTSMPKKLTPLEKCPKCSDLLVYRYTSSKGEKVFKCLNKDCLYVKNSKINIKSN